MCGICGRYNFGIDAPVAESELRKMNGLLVHRGPDDEGYFAEGSAGIAMRRLSIIDLSTGHQPISNEDETVWVVLNGEIYNFQQLREELERKGHVFRTKSDTEAIVHLYEDLGLDCVKKLRGMFAFAVWDKKNRRMMLGRDRIGKKPLVYAQMPGWIAFASELRSLLALDGIPRDIEYSALDLYLSLQYIPSPLTIYKSIKKLPPGHILVADKNGVRTESYWDLPLNSSASMPDYEEAKAMVVEKLREAVKIRMISDVPLGAFLSGGIDSSVITALMSGLSSRPVKTFSIGFEEAEFSELHYAKALAEMYGCDHHEFIVKPEMADVLPKLAWHYGEPYADSSALPSYYVARETRRHVTVALNGDGGDENFAGYLRYFAMKLAHYWDVLPGSMRRFISGAAEFLPEGTAPVDIFWRAKRFLRSGIFSDLPARHLKMVGYFSDEEKNRLFTGGMKSVLGSSLNGGEKYFSDFFRRSEHEDFINRILYVDMKTYLPECLMVKMDIAAMANSLEGRSPFLDHELMESVFRLPGHWKFKGINGLKHILKDAFKDKLPPAICKRGKQGFGIPLGAWFRGRMKSYWEEHCLSSNALKRGYFVESELKRFWQDHQSGKRDHGFRLWALLMLELWHETYEPDSHL